MNLKINNDKISIEIKLGFFDYLNLRRSVNDTKLNPGLKRKYTKSERLRVEYGFFSAYIAIKQSMFHPRFFAISVLLTKECNKYLDKNCLSCQSQ